MAEIPLAVLPGTGVGAFGSGVAYRHWVSSPRDRIFPLPGRGLASLDQTYLEVERQLLRWGFETGKRFAIAGHSQGAYHAVRFALNHPSMVLAVVAVGGPFGGALQPPFVPKSIDRLARSLIPVAADFKQESLALSTLARRVEEAWPADIPLTLVAGHRDQLVRPRRSAHSLTCDRIRHVYVGPWRPKGLPWGIEHAFAPFAGHTSQIFMPPVVRLVREGCAR